MVHRRAPIVGLALLIGLALTIATPRLVAAADPLPDRLSDREFWQLSEQLSEADGFFRSDNLLSNELYYPEVMAELVGRVRPGRVYLGVGPEQNFHYIAAIRPAIAVIFDIRRQAVMQHLLFKALFELSADRADFIARLFSLPKPEGITRGATIDVIWQRVGQTPSTDRTRLDANVADVEARLKAHGFALSDEDKESLEYVYAAFFRLGPAITYAGDRAGLSTGNTNFMKLTAATDDAESDRKI